MIAIASSIPAFVVGSTMFFVVGFLCGHFCQRKEKKKAEMASPPAEEKQTPYYANIDQFDIQPKQNVAYGQVSQTNL